MNIWKKLVTALALVCLLVNTVPAVSATGDAREGLDYSELEMQVGIANGLNSYDYTMQSWAKLEAALEVGNRRLEGIYDQGKLDAAAEDIATAVAELVDMDYAPLNTALDAVKAKIAQNPELHDAWYRLDNAVEEANELLFSGDQEAVNAAATQLYALLEEISQRDTVTVEPELIVQEVEVEVLPTNDFCNIPVHRTWPLLFVISAVLNVVLVIILIYVVMKKQNTVDNTPLVNYDIDDDMLDDDMDF